MHEVDLRRVQQKFHEGADAKRFKFRLQNPFIREREMSLFKAIGPVPDGLVVEIGCGEGSNAIYLHMLNPKPTYVGIDFSFDKMSFANQVKDNQQSFFLQGDALSPPILKGCADLVFIRDLLHHIDASREKAIQSALSLLRPGGRLVLIEANGQILLNVIFRLLVPAEQGLRNSTPEKFTAMCRSLGASRIEFIEPLFLIRGLNYLLGWRKEGVAGGLVKILYHLFSHVEKWLGRFIKKEDYAYMVASFEPGSTKKP